MNISKRLLKVASFVPDNSNLIDVGCDHALLDIYLATTLKSVKILATDINNNPLSAAKQNIEKYNLEDKIKLEQKNGIENLDKEIDTIVIAGMGGILISDILNNKKSLKNVKNIIVAPNNDFPCVRKIIKKQGFKIEKEELLTEKNITYLIIKATKGHKKLNYFFGTLDNNNQEVVNYYNKLLKVNNDILKKLPSKYIFKKIKLKKENKDIKNFINNS